MGVWLLLSVLAAVLISTLPGADKASIERSASILGGVPPSPGDEAIGDTKAAAPVDVRPTAYRRHEGFAGFRGYRLTPSGPAAVRTSMAPQELPIGRLVAMNTDYIGEPSAHATGAGDGYNDGLPGLPTFMDIEFPGARSRHIRSPLSSDRQTQIDLAERDRPPVLKLEPVRYPKRGWHVNGVVKMVLVVDAEGNIRECQIVEEDPDGHDFAQALKDALYESRFFPPRVNGAEVGARYEFTYEFCWECPQKPEIVVTRGDLVVNPSVGE